MVDLKTTGVPNKETVKQLNVCGKTVYNAWKHVKESGIIFGKQIPGKVCTLHSRSIISTTKKKMERNPQRSVRKMPKYAGI